MKNIIKKIIKISLSPFILGDYLRFERLYKKTDRSFLLRAIDFYPQIKDKTVETGFDRHYVYHTAWAARILARTKPAFHIDISSSLYFNAIASAFVPIEFYDYRPADLSLDNFKAKEGNLMRLPFTNNSVKSLSCMHTIEHVGLGRYGDPIDPDGDLKAIDELKRVLAIGGSLLFVVPIGKIAKIQFNAHRIYTYDQVISYFKGLELKEFALIPEHGHNGAMIRNARIEDVGDESYACGCFWFTKN